MLCVPCFVAVAVPCRAVHDDVRDLSGNVRPVRGLLWSINGVRFGDAMVSGYDA